MASFKKLASAKPMSPGEIMKRRKQELEEMGTGEKPKTKVETEIEYQKRMRKKEEKDK